MALEKEETEKTTQAGSVLSSFTNAAGNQEAMDDPTQSECDSLFQDDGRGFFSFANFEHTEECSPFGLTLEDKTLETLRKINLINQNDEDSEEENLLNFDFFDVLHDTSKLPSELRITSKIHRLNFFGIVEGYSMEIILRQINTNLLVLINGSEEESNRLKECKLDIKKVKILKEDYSTRLVS